MTVRLIRAFDGCPAGGVYRGTPAVEADLVAQGNAAYDLHASSGALVDGTRAGGISFVFDVGGNDTQVLVLSAPHGGTFTSAVTQSSGGSATFTFNINGVAMSATPNAVSSVKTTQPINGLGIFVPGDTISVTRSADASCTNAAGSLTYTPSKG